MFNEEDEFEHESPFKSIIADIRGNLSKRGHKLIKNGLKCVEEMKDLTYSQIKSFKEKLIEFNNDLIKKNKIKKDFDDYYEKHKIKTVKDVKYLSDDSIYEDIRCLFNETNDIESNEIKFYEAKPYEVEYCEVRSNKIKSYEIDYIDTELHEIRSNEIKSYEVDYIDIKPQQIKSYEAKPYEVEHYEVRSNKIKSYEIDYIDIKHHESKSYNIDSSKDYYIRNIKNEFNKLSNNLVEANVKDIRCIVDYINNGEDLKEIPINLEDTRDKFIAYNDTLSFGILSNSSYIDLRKMNIIYSVIFDAEYKPLETKALKSLKMPLFLGFLKYISEEEYILEYIELNKNKV